MLNNKFKNILIRLITEIARILLGLTFVFSGFVKSIDPKGTIYKIDDYLINFNLSNLTYLSDYLSILLCLCELCLGLFMLLGLYRKWTSYILFVVMLFMTPLTLYLAVANPVKDCGCFGDALILTNWQTFFKNIVLLGCSVIVIIWNQKIINLFTGKFYWLTGLYTFCFCLAFCLYNYFNEPLIDFRPYKPGVNIREAMRVEDKKGPKFENILIYEKNGVEKEFTEDNYPWTDSTWIYVDTKTKLIEDGEEPLIKDFALEELTFNLDKTEILSKQNITNTVLADTGYTFLMIAYSLPDADLVYLSRCEDISNYAKEFQYNFYCLTSSSDNEILDLEKNNTMNFRYCQTDERTLKTIARSNPSIMLIKNGVIVNKFTSNNIPEESSLNKPIENLTISKTPDINKENRGIIIKILLIYFGPIIFLKLLDILFYQRRKKRRVI